MQSAEMHTDRMHLIAAATFESNIQCQGATETGVRHAAA